MNYYYYYPEPYIRPIAVPEFCLPDSLCCATIGNAKSTTYHSKWSSMFFASPIHCGLGTNDGQFNLPTHLSLPQ